MSSSVGCVGCLLEEKGSWLQWDLQMMSSDGFGGAALSERRPRIQCHQRTCTPMLAWPKWIIWTASWSLQKCGRSGVACECSVQPKTTKHQSQLRTQSVWNMKPTLSNNTEMGPKTMGFEDLSKWGVHDVTCAWREALKEWRLAQGCK